MSKYKSTNAMLNSREACEFLNVSPRTLSKIKKNGALHYYKPGGGRNGRTYFTKEDLQAYLNAGRR